MARRKAILLCLLFLPIVALSSGVWAQSASQPLQPPDAATGLDLYSERCALCHGALGLGDGPQAAAAVNPPTAHASPDFLRAAVPAEMFATITDGRIDGGMPPFGPTSSNPIAEADIWNLIGAIYSLGTPVESVELGQGIYEANCRACHGQSGLGDGPEAGGLDAEIPDITSLEYWSNRSNQAIFDRLASGEPDSVHSYSLDEEELWPVVDYIRAFSYQYSDAQARFRPLESAEISGQVTNGTDGQPLSGGASVLLRAFTQELEIKLTLTTTVSIDGQYRFDLSDVEQDWFYRVSVGYEDVDFGSDFGQLTYLEPELDLPVTVFDKSTDSSALSIRQLHVVLGFLADFVQVSELYVVDNASSTVYVGPTGDASGGTFELAVPDGATNLSFQRGFGSIDSYIPANEFIQTSGGWSDTLPLRPGPGSLTIAVQYTLPYENGAVLSHPLHYPTDGINLVMPDTGVMLQERDGWAGTGQQTLESGTFLTYGRSSLPASGILSMSLSGRPRAGTSSLVRDNTTEMLVGGGAAVVVLAIAVYAVRQWRGGADEGLTRDELLDALAALDDEFEAGLIDEDAYLDEREELKAELLELWDE